MPNHQKPTDCFNGKSSLTLQIKASSKKEGKYVRAWYLIGTLKNLSTGNCKVLAMMVRITAPQKNEYEVIPLE